MLRIFEYAPEQHKKRTEKKGERKKKDKQMKRKKKKGYLRYDGSDGSIGLYGDGDARGVFDTDLDTNGDNL